MGRLRAGIRLITVYNAYSQSELNQVGDSHPECFDSLFSGKENGDLGEYNLMCSYAVTIIYAFSLLTLVQELVVILNMCYVGITVLERSRSGNAMVGHIKEDGVDVRSSDVVALTSNNTRFTIAYWKD
ncbi:hypothetical protein BDB01DRAFT_833747 [Pilobolus umbonatus]|nr:hypothetical protein BDB01DRAFT_833747 [Pilobolus umbonatus]